MHLNNCFNSNYEFFRIIWDGSIVKQLHPRDGGSWTVDGAIRTSGMSNAVGERFGETTVFILMSTISLRATTL